MQIGGRQITRQIDIIQDLKEKKKTGAYDRSFSFDKKFQEFHNISVKLQRRNDLLKVPLVKIMPIKLTMTQIKLQKPTHHLHNEFK